MERPGDHVRVGPLLSNVSPYYRIAVERIVEVHMAELLASSIQLTAIVHELKDIRLAHLVLTTADLPVLRFCADSLAVVS